MSQAQQPEALRLAHDIGANIIQVQPTEAERLRFEAWMKGHCWKVCGQWDGTTYSGSNESPDYLDPQVMHTRQLFAAWRDCAALRDQIPAPAAQAVEPVEVELPDVEDMAHSALEEALSGGVGHDVFHRWMRAVMDKTVAALRAAPAPAAVAVPPDVLNALMEARSALSSINRGDVHRVKVGDDLCYWQREEWVDWAAQEVLPLVEAALAATPPAQAQLSPVAAQVIDNLLHLARVVERAVEDWGESFADGSSVVKFHKEEADKMESILEFFDSLPDAPPEEGVTESGPLRAARVLRTMAAPQAQDVQREADDCFELWWADHMPNATQVEAFAAWTERRAAGAAQGEA